MRVLMTISSHLAQAHRSLEELKLRNERNRIMRLEVLLQMGSLSLALAAVSGGFFGMNLHSGVEEVPHLLWLVAGGTAGASTLLLRAFLRSVRTFHGLQRDQLLATSALQTALQGADPRPRPRPPRPPGRGSTTPTSPSATPASSRRPRRASARAGTAARRRPSRARGSQRRSRRRVPPWTSRSCARCTTFSPRTRTRCTTCSPGHAGAKRGAAWGRRAPASRVRIGM
ncbi:hypothetical protein EMIHUDRAFT_437992 [Emiliania huxleyi CCMP1516]|uniref:Magnesium transporter n=2 Tax=Emiliania huxleyi TaxID=2903 RepID=A0A0D3IFK9_EMIH1|nr:hypothetical protein EMIHUDRAFT_437992 [Emiliania huxleyi CCMP1516]EOD10044.1 hypothetical protein EMIHUDRAFT_437992 [Emiliania huxleyi CCMP1516]|eukprot:XP_005762473.1 hypothetical protein EMIHUDRAFT_437992 [Emiliania huxleyi CCMP1516]